MTGDPLDRASEAIRDAIDAGGDFLNEPVGKAGIAALDALVEVARAAREACEAMERLDAGLETNSEAGTPDWFLLPEQGLRAALARLDGPR